MKREQKSRYNYTHSETVSSGFGYYICTALNCLFPIFLTGSLTLVHKHIQDSVDTAAQSASRSRKICQFYHVHVIYVLTFSLVRFLFLYIVSKMYELYTRKQYVLITDGITALTLILFSLMARFYVFRITP